MGAHNILDVTNWATGVQANYWTLFGDTTIITTSVEALRYILQLLNTFDNTIISIKLAVHHLTYNQ